jgi:hypothetical protein
MSKEMKRSLFVGVLFVLGVVFFQVWHIRLFCSFAAGVNFETFMVAWRIKNNESPL